MITSHPLLPGRREPTLHRPGWRCSPLVKVDQGQMSRCFAFFSKYRKVESFRKGQSGGVCFDAVAQQGNIGVYLREHDTLHALEVKWLLPEDSRVLLSQPVERPGEQEHGLFDGHARSEGGRVDPLKEPLICRDRDFGRGGEQGVTQLSRGVGHRFLEERERGWLLFDQGPLGQRVLPETLKHVGTGRSQTLVEAAYQFGDTRLNSFYVQTLLVAEIVKQQPLADTGCFDDAVRRSSQVAICGEFTDRRSDQSGPPAVGRGGVR